MLFLICWYEHGNRAATLVHWHSWYLQSLQSLDIITWTAITSAHMAETRISGQVIIVPSCAMVPGGTGTALTPIQMDSISHPAPQVMHGPCIIKAFAVIGRAYVQWNSCLDRCTTYYNNFHIIFVNVLNNVIRTI